MGAVGGAQVLTEQYRALPCAPGPAGGSGKLLALDEAHKFMDGVAADGLSAAIVNVARLMRHDGVRLAVSTQSPAALAPELLELVTVAVLHRFHSRDWFAYLAKKLPLPDAARERLMELQPGHALVFASQHRVRAAGCRLGPVGAEGDGGEEDVGSDGQRRVHHLFQVRPPTPRGLGLPVGRFAPPRHTRRLHRPKGAFETASWAPMARKRLPCSRATDRWPLAHVGDARAAAAAGAHPPADHGGPRRDARQHSGRSVRLPCWRRGGQLCGARWRVVTA